MRKDFFDLCPVSNNNETISIDYIAYSGVDIGETRYSKSRFSCSNPTCSRENCPLFKKAPSNF